MLKLKVKQIRSIIDRPEPQKRTIIALGLGRPNWEKIHNDTPQIRGMVYKVRHLVEVSEYEPTDGEQKKTKAVVKKKAPAKKATSTKTKKTKTSKKKEVKSE
jgi:large subunit ribosomal protein L30